jgi:hypothetical protein
MAASVQVNTSFVGERNGAAIRDVARVSVRHSRWLLIGVVVFSTLVLASRLQEGFIPNDDPVQAHAAERVLQGDRPHVQFHDTYTGGLTYLNAFSLWLFGIRLESPRIMLALFFVPWVACFWWLAQKLTSPWPATLLTLLAVVWSVPLYPTSLPSWYNLYFATFGTAALFRYIETRLSRWIFLAGLLAGLSFLAKISGLYFLAALGLFLIYDEQNLQESVRYRDRNVTGSTFSALLTLTLVGFDTALLWLVHSRLDIDELYHFALPGFALTFFLIVREWREPRFAMPIRLWQVAGRLFPLMVGAALPVVLFLVPYWLTGTLGMWYTNVFALSAARLQHVFYAPIGAVAGVCCLPLFVALGVNRQLVTPSMRRFGLAVLSILAAAAIILGLRSPGFVRLIWVSVATSIPVLTAAAVAILLNRRRIHGQRESQFVLLVLVAALCSLIQFPFSAPIYFCYVSPLVILVCVALVEVEAEGQSLLPLLPMPVFYLVFSTLLIMPSQIYTRGLTLSPVAQKAFTLPRAEALHGDIAMVDMYEQAVAEVKKHQGNAPIYAGPDAAELYFLAAGRNPTPILYECLAGSDREPNQILASVDHAGVRVVVISHRPHNDSGPPDPELLAGLRRRFPESVAVGYFEIRWIDARS